MKRKAAACMLAAALAVTCIPASAMAKDYTYGGEAGKGENLLTGATKLGDIDVKVQVKSESVTHKYAVDLITEEVKFVYDLGTSTWNPSDHQYTGGTANWETNSKTFTVENHSDLPIKVSVPDSILITDPNLKKVTVAAAFSNGQQEVTLGAHPIGNVADGDWKTDGTITLAGAPEEIDPEDYTTAKSIATVTVTINEVGQP